MKIRYIFLVGVFSIINLAFSANDEIDNKITEEDDLKEVFNIMFSLDTWGMANDDKLIVDMLDFLKSNSENKYSFIISDELKNRLNWKSYNNYKSITNIDSKSFTGWNRRYFENLLIKFYYLNNETEKIHGICKSRTFVPEYYVAGPLKENWNQQLRTQWSYLLDLDFIFNTPFGDVKYQKVKNVNYINNISQETKITSDFDNDNDYIGETYLCSFSAYFHKDTELFLKLDENDLDIYINGYSWKKRFNDDNFSNSTLLPIKFCKGRFDFVIQTQNYPKYFNAEFLLFDGNSISDIDFNTHFYYDYGKWSILSKFNIYWKFHNNDKQIILIENNKYLSLNELIYTSVKYFTSNSDIASFFHALNSDRNNNYEIWETLKTLHENYNSPIYSYFFAKYNSQYSSLPSNYEHNFSKPILDELVKNYPDLIKPKIDLFEYENSRNNYNSALKILVDILRDNPQNKVILKENIKFYEDVNWIALKHSMITKTSEMYPNDVELLIMKINIYQSHNNINRVKELYKMLFNIIPHSIKTYHLWKDYLLVCKNNGDNFIEVNRLWLNVIELFKDSATNIIEDYCDYLVNCGEYDKAQIFCKELFNKTPNLKYAKKLSDIYFLLDNKSEGINYLIKSIKMNHKKNIAEKEYLLHLLKNSDTELYKLYSLPLNKVLETKINPIDYPNASSIVLLDEEIKRIFSDGSSTSIITTVRKILTQEGVEEYGVASISGDLIEAKVIKSDGDIYEPSVLDNTINFEGIEIGSTQIIISREITEKFNSKFYFSDPERKEYFLNSRIVILKSKYYTNLNIIENLVKPIKIYDNSEYQITIYEVKNSSPVPEEHDFEPKISDFLPYINLTNATIDPQLAHFYLLEKKVTFASKLLVERKAEQLIRNKKLIFDKVKSIYNFVATSITNDNFIDSPTEILIKGSGNREILFFALLSYAHIKYDKIKVLTTEALMEYELSKNNNSFADIDYIDAVRIENGDNYIYQILNPRIMEHIPFGFMPYPGAIGFTFNNQIDYFIIANDKCFEYLIDSSNFNIDIESSEALAIGSTILSLNNSNLLKYFLPQFSDNNKRQLLTQIINDRLSNFLISTYKLENNDNNKPLTINIEGKFLNSVHEIDNKTVEVSMCLKPLELLHKFTPTAKRKLKMKIDENEYSFNIDRRIIAIPDNYMLLNIPSSAFYFTKAFIYLLDVSRLENKIILTRKWKTFPAIYDTIEYDTFKQYCNAVDTLENKSITLLKIAENSK